MIHSRNRDTLLREVLIALVVIFFAGGSPVQAQDGIDLYVEACRHRGDNPAVIQSVSLELEARILTEPPSDEQVQKKTEEVKQGIREMMKRNENNENLMDHLKLTLERVNDDLVSAQLQAQASKRLKVHVLFRLSPEGHSQYRQTLRQFDAEKNDWTEPLESIRERDSRASLKGLYFEPRDHTAIVNAGAFNVGIGDVRQFGRIQGSLAQKATFAFVDPAHPETLDFSEKNIKRFKAEVKTVAKANQNVTPFRIMREEPFEGSMVQVVETNRRENGREISMQRVWIDPSRGYISPLVELFYEDGRTAQKWESSGYFQEVNSGLWYPQRHVYKQFGNDGTQIRMETYVMNAESLTLNNNPPSEAFTVELPANLLILDTRTDPHKRYRSSKPVNISLERLSEDIAALPPDEERAVTPASRVILHSNQRWLWVMGANLMVLAIVAALLAWRRRNKKSQIVT